MNRKINQLGLMGPAMAMLMATGAASAQSAASGGGRQGYDHPMKARTRVAQPAQPGQQSKTESRWSMTRSDDSGTYSVKIDGDDISATIDGKDVPGDRIQRDDDGVKLLDEDGKVVAEFQIATGAAPGAWAGQSGGQWKMALPMQGQAYFSTGSGASGDPIAMTPDNPPVMLGITMGEPSDSLLDHLGLDKGSAVLIDKVYDGLPAEKAGLKDSDILVELDGQKPLDEGKVREILKSKQPGDEIKATIIRKGASKDLKIKLEAYDAGKLGGQGGNQVELFTPQDMQGLQGFQGMGWDVSGDAHKALEEALKNIEKLRGQEDADAVRAQAHKALEEALKSLEAGGAMQFKSPHAFAGPGGGGGTVILGPRPGQVYTTPAQPAAPAPPASRNADLSRQMDDLRAQLEEVQKSRDELKQQLDEIKAMLKEMRDQGRDHR